MVLDPWHKMRRIHENILRLPSQSLQGYKHRCLNCKIAITVSGIARSEIGGRQQKCNQNCLSICRELAQKLQLKSQWFKSMRFQIDCRSWIPKRFGHLRAQDHRPSPPLLSSSTSADMVLIGLALAAYPPPLTERARPKRKQEGIERRERERERNRLHWSKQWLPIQQNFWCQYFSFSELLAWGEGLRLLSTWTQRAIMAHVSGFGSSHRHWGISCRAMKRSLYCSSPVLVAATFEGFKNTAYEMNFEASKKRSPLQPNYVPILGEGSLVPGFLDQCHHEFCATSCTASEILIRAFVASCTFCSCSWEERVRKIAAALSRAIREACCRCHLHNALVLKSPKCQELAQNCVLPSNSVCSRAPRILRWKHLVSWLVAFVEEFLWILLRPLYLGIANGEVPGRRFSNSWMCCVFFAWTSVMARELLLKIDTSLAIATSGLRTNLLFEIEDKSVIWKTPLPTTPHSTFPNFSWKLKDEKRRNFSPKFRHIFQISLSGLFGITIHEKLLTQGAQRLLNKAATKHKQKNKHLSLLVILLRHLDRPCGDFRQEPKGFQKRGIHDQGDFWKSPLETTVENALKFRKFDLSMDTPFVDTPFGPARADHLLSDDIFLSTSPRPLLPVASLVRPTCHTIPVLHCPSTSGSTGLRFSCAMVMCD